MQLRVTPNPFGVPGGVSVTKSIFPFLIFSSQIGFNDLFNGIAQ